MCRAVVVCLNCTLKIFSSEISECINTKIGHQHPWGSYFKKYVFRYWKINVTLFVLTKVPILSKLYLWKVKNNDFCGYLKTVIDRNKLSHVKMILHKCNKFLSEKLLHLWYPFHKLLKTLTKFFTVTKL